MPIYEFRCPKCQKNFEEWVRLADAHGQEPCPECGALSPRIMSHTSFVLKGGGWYVSDYGYRKGVHEEGTQPSESKESGESSAKKSTETSSAGKADTANASSPKTATPSDKSSSASGSGGSKASGNPA
ncbi:MAG: zinc ribbon domain-containing protein [Desulfovibrio sp.]|nr:zinc ribbon domain-containing protein [Desulfovibrio sp.]